MLKKKSLMVNLDADVFDKLIAQAEKNARTITAELTLILKKALRIKDKK